MVDKKRKTDPFSRQVEEIVLAHLKRMERISPNETVERVQTYLGGFWVAISDAGSGRRTLYLELGNQSSALFVYRIDDFLKDLARLCGNTVDSIYIVETSPDIRNKQHCLATINLTFCGKTLSEWAAGNGGGLQIFVTTLKKAADSNETSVVKTIRIQRAEDGTSSVSIDLPELIDLFDLALTKNFNETLISWLRDEVKTDRVKMETHEEAFKTILNKFQAKIVRKGE